MCSFFILKFVCVLMRHIASIIFANYANHLAVLFDFYGHISRSFPVIFIIYYHRFNSYFRRIMQIILPILSDFLYILRSFIPARFNHFLSLF